MRSMVIICENKPKSTVHITLTIPVEEQESFLKKAADELGKKLKVDGFRPGHIPFEIVKKEVGDMSLLEVASEEMIKKGLIQAIKEHQLETIGQPNVKIKKLVPGNDVEVDIEWAHLPHIELPDIATISIDEKKMTAEDQEVDESLEHIRKMRAAEAATTEPATAQDRVVVDMDMFVDNVAIEGGSTKNHSIYLNEDSYVTGLTEQLIGVKKDEQKEFELDIPKTHYSKLLAGKTATFKVNVREVYQRTLPPLDDEFAKGLGTENIDALKRLLRENITRDKQSKEEERATGEMIDVIISKTTFGDIPDILIENEKHRLFAEFKARLEDQGLTLENYLADIKKTVEEVAEGFVEQGEKRVKASLAFRALAKQEGITIDDKELKLEMEDVRRAYQDHPNIEERLKDEDIIDYITVNLRNRKVTQKLKEKLIKKPEPQSTDTTKNA